MGKSHLQKVKHKEEKDGEVKKLRTIIRRLESDKRKLISELSTLEEAFSKNIQFLKGKTSDLTLNELVSAAKKEMTLSQVEDYKDVTFSDMEKKWKCFKCEIGILKIVRYSIGDAPHYFRMCSNDKCKKRTPPKAWDDSVKGVRQIDGKKLNKKVK